MGLIDGSINGGPSDVLFMPIGTTWMGDVDKPVVISGRMFDPDVPDELVVNEDAIADGTLSCRRCDALPR